MPLDLLRVALAQINPTVGDIAGNAAQDPRRGSAARATQGAQLVVFPELALTGYPPEDLLLKTALPRRRGRRARGAGRARRDGHRRARRLPGARATTSTTRARCSPTARSQAVYRKMYLPNYGVFDEQRYFQAGTEAALIELNGVAIGLTICEDIWEPGPPATTEALAGAQVIVNLSASPYHARQGPPSASRCCVQRARDNLAAVVFCNMVGGQDELVFDGHSVAIDQDGELVAARAAVRGGADRLRRRPRRRRGARGCATPATARRCARARERGGDAPWPRSPARGPSSDRAARSAAARRAARSRRRRSTRRS